MAQDVRGEDGAAGGLLLLAVLLVLELLHAFVFGVGGELVLDDGVGLRVVDAAGGGEQLRDALPLADFGRAAFGVGQVLAVAFEGLLQPGFLERGRGPCGGHAGGADRAAADLRPVDRLAGRGRAGCRDAQTTAGSGNGGAHTSLPIVVETVTDFRPPHGGCGGRSEPKHASCHRRSRTSW
ncbi:hypothetical protein [Streptomyces sp. NPDC001843]|uniref:hypothetical protein n=1 Tax=Streptomyces sp. NPDC001843 TaxID=3364617 RepID=UPI0036959FEF